MVNACCPTCGQTLPVERLLGLRFAAGETRLLDLIRRAGPHGMQTDHLFARLYGHDPNGGPASGMNIVRVRIYHMNLKLRPIGHEIACVERGGPGIFGRYVFRQIPKVAA